MRLRIIFLISGTLLLFSVLIFNLYNLQIKKGHFYTAKAESQIRLSGYLEPRRGNIYFTDRNKNLIPAALNKEYPIIFAVPKEISDPDQAAKTLAAILELSEERIKRSLIKENDLYELILVKATPDQVAQVKAAGIKGVYVDGQNFRFYPFGDLASQVSGFVGESDRDSEIRGRYGLELYFDDFLRGVPGGVDSKDREKIVEPIDGEDLVLTIDRNIQAQAEEILKNLVKKYEAVSGTVIVQEPETGKILALGNYPGFDPNEYSKYPLQNFLNPALEAIYEPGSVFKVITMAAGIDSGKITPQTKYTDTGSVTINGRTIENWDLKTHGTVTMSQVIEGSINTGAVFAQRKTGPDIFYNYLLKFGFEESTGIALPGELSGNLSPLRKDAREINFATASFGQGVSVTPIELIAAISAIANDGLLMKPLIVEGEDSRVIRRVISKETADQVTEMMASAVRKAQIAQIPNYEIAGKTGTAQVPDFKNGGYTDEVINTYMGFAPASSPRFVILLKIEKPKGAPLAGLTVVPAFRELAEFILNYYNIPPDSLSVDNQP